MREPSCKHEFWDSHVEVERTDDIRTAATVYMAVKLKVNCKGCGIPLQFLGDFPTVAMPGQPTASRDRLRLRLPVQPPRDAPYAGVHIAELEDQIRAAGLRLR